MSEESFASCLGKTFFMSRKTKEHILKHPEMLGEFEKIRDVLNEPDEVRTSTHDSRALLFYKLYAATKVSSKYLLVAAKALNDEGFIITAFFADKMKKGVAIWRKS